MSDEVERRVCQEVYLPAELWAWLEAVAERDGVSRSDLLEGIVLMAIDEEELQESWRPVVDVKVDAGVL